MISLVSLSPVSESCTPQMHWERSGNLAHSVFLSLSNLNSSSGLSCEKRSETCFLKPVTDVLSCFVLLLLCSFGMTKQRHFGTLKEELYFLSSPPSFYSFVGFFSPPVPLTCPFRSSPSPASPPSRSLLISTLLSPSSFPSFSPSFNPTLALLPLHQILKQISHEISSFLHPLSSCRSLLPSTLDVFARSPLHGLRVSSPLDSPILNDCAPARCRNVNGARDGLVRFMKKRSC